MPVAMQATPYIAKGEISMIVDPRMGTDYPLEALHGMGAVALMCTQQHGKKRPEMSAVAWRLGEVQKMVPTGAGSMPTVKVAIWGFPVLKKRGAGILSGSAC